MGTADPPPEPRFLVDAMLGNVARDLRLLGYDALYAGRQTDAQILRTCQATQRILVTRDAHLARRTGSLPCVRVRESAPEKQAPEVLRALGQRVFVAPRPFTRCLVCNGSLELLTGPEALARIPDHWAHGDTEIHHCRWCGRTYWPGSHLAGLSRRVRQLSEALQAGDPNV